MTDEFTERYRGFSDRKLMEIIHHPEDYLPEAVLAAKAEIEERELTAEELGAAKEAMESHLNKRTNWDWTQIKPLRGVKDWLGKFTLAWKMRMAFVIALVLEVGFRKGGEISGMVEFMFSFGFDTWTFILLLPSLILILALPFFAFKKKIGWSMLAFVGSYGAVFTAFSLGVFAYGLLFFQLPNGQWDPERLLFDAFSMGRITLYGLTLAVGIHIKPIRAQFEITPIWIVVGNGLGFLLAVTMLYMGFFML